MDFHEQTTDHRKKRRRRGKRIPISAHLTLEDQGKGHVGAISQELFDDLFGRQQEPDASAPESGVRYIALSPWQPPSTAAEENCSWTIVPVQVSADLVGPSKILFSTSALALSRLAVALHGSNARPKAGFGVLVLDVQPLPLDTIFVKVDGKALQKHEEVQRRFGGGFQAHQTNGYVGKGKGKASESMLMQKEKLQHKSLEDRLRAAIRTSLAEPAIVHKGDLLPLPLPAHPITHVPFPPIKVTICEPVDQGSISGQTRIVIDIDNRGKDGKSHTFTQPRNNLLRGAARAEEDDTSAERFYSAVENDESKHRPRVERKDSTTSQSSASDGSGSDDGSLSDDSADNIISLSTPMLPTQSSGVMSSMTAATPRPVGYRMNGISTPGSVFSTYTATTARQGKRVAGKTFQIKPLIAKVPDSILHPSPTNDEDDEARVFVDVKMLVRLGCFSGDWVRITTTNSKAGQEHSWPPMGAFGEDESPPEKFMVAKIYGLPDLITNDVHRYPKKETARRISHNSALPAARANPQAYISPVLFANLKSPSIATLSAMSPKSHADKVSKSKITSSSIPPIAKELTLLRLPTPLSTERAVQSGLFASLKQYFESRRRILKKGDLVAIPMDVGISRILSDIGEQDHDTEELFLISGGENPHKDGTMAVAWFKVGHITISSSEDDDRDMQQEVWGGATSIEPMETRMKQAGSELGKIPPTMENPWEYYLGIRRCPSSIMSSNQKVRARDSLPKPYISPIRQRMRQLLAAATSTRAKHLGMKPIVFLLHSTQRNIGKSHLAMSACADLGLHSFPIDAYDILSEGGAGGGDVKTEASMRAKIDRALTCGAQYTVPLIQHAEALTAERMASALKDILGDLCAMILTTTELDKIPEGVRSLFTHELEILAPDEGEREGILQGIVDSRGVKLGHDVDLSAIAIKTAALVAGDLVDVVDRALVARQERLEQLIHASPSSPEQILIRDILVSGGPSARALTAPDFGLAVDAARKNFADGIGAPKIPNVSWSDVGGLSHVKSAVMETIQLPLERPELFAKGMKKRSGILFYGPPGTGKTLLAKAIATEFSLNFFSVKGPELLNMYIGESEANVRRVFRRARDARPCVVFFDELDSVAPKRGNQGDSGGVMDRIVSQLLAELDGMSDGDGDGGSGGVFVIGATNRPDLLDQALLRPGRFDKMLYLGVADTHDKQLTILEALTRKFALGPDLELRRVAETLPFTYTGADLYALCSDAMLKAVMRKAKAVEGKIQALPPTSTGAGGKVGTAWFFDHLAKEEDVAVVVEEGDFEGARRELVGSVSANELEHYHRVRQTFEGPSQPARPPPKTIQPTNGPAPPSSSNLTPPLSTAASGKGNPKSPHHRTVKHGTAGHDVKGKGKVTVTMTTQQWDSDDEDVDDEAYVTSNDYGSPARYRDGVLGEGNGKERAVDGFGDAEEEEEEGLYE